MKHITFLLSLFFIFSNIAAQQLIPADAGSTVKFTIKNFGFGVTGSFTGLKGTILFDASNTSNASFAVSVDAATINTGNGARDKHLRKEEYFDVEKFPVINFASSSISQTKPGKFMMLGKLSIKGITKAVSFPFTATPQNGGYLLAGSFKINRRDFGVGGSSMVLADNLEVSLSVAAIKK